MDFIGSAVELELILSWAKDKLYNNRSGKIIFVPGHGGINYDTSHYINGKGLSSQGQFIKNPWLIQETIKRDRGTDKNHSGYIPLTSHSGRGSSPARNKTSVINNIRGKNQFGIARWVFEHRAGTFIVREWRFESAREYEVNLNITHLGRRINREDLIGYSDYFIRSGQAIMGKNSKETTMITFGVHKDYRDKGLGSALSVVTLLSAKALECTLVLAHQPVTSIFYNIGFVFMESQCLGVFDLIGQLVKLSALKESFGIRDFSVSPIEEGQSSSPAGKIGPGNGELHIILER
jgi:hypothetical protein